MQQLLASPVLLLLLFASALWDKDRRGWHDKIAGTVVVEMANLGPSGATGNDYINGGVGTDTCTRGETTAGCDEASRP